MRQLGLEKQGSHLNLDDIAVSCVPFDLSLTKASVLAFLSQKEVPFFVRCVILSFRKPDPDSPYCFIDLRFGEVPLILKEALVTWFVETDKAELYWKEALAEGRNLSPEALALVLPNADLEILKDGATADRLRAVSLSPKRFRVFGEYKGILPENRRARKAGGRSSGLALIRMLSAQI
jgi:hypothetical protein